MYKERFIAVIKYNGKVLRERDDVVTLPFGSEYSIMLKNLESRKAVVNVSVDGDDVLDGKSIIVAPNSEMELKGFMKGTAVRNRFKFIQKTKDISDYRGDKLDDGIVRVEFKYEKKVTTEIKREEKYTYPKIWWDYRCPVCGNWPCTCIKWYSYNDFNFGSSSFYCLNDSGGSGGLSCNSGDNTVNCFSSSFTADNAVGAPMDDEGITVKGSETKQDFTYGYTRELEEDSSVIVLRLRGTTKKGTAVNKPVTVRTKLTCPTCGRKSRSSAKFCKNCGTCLV
jgi:hypothetical protein